MRNGSRSCREVGVDMEKQCTVSHENSNMQMIYIYAYAFYVHCTMYIYDDIYTVEMIPYVSWEHLVSQTSSGNSSQVVGKA